MSSGGGRGVQVELFMLVNVLACRLFKSYLEAWAYGCASAELVSIALFANCCRRQTEREEMRMRGKRVMLQSGRK